MTASPLTTDRPAAKHRRRAPLLVGLVIIALASGGYLGWQHFAHGPSAAKPEPPFPSLRPPSNNKISRSR